MFLECTACPFHASIDAGARRPPWCPCCGGDLKQAAASQATTAPGAAAVFDPARIAARQAPAPGAAVATIAELPAAGSPAGKGPAAQTPRSTGAVPPSPHDEGGAAEAVFRANPVWLLLAGGCVLACLGITLAAASQLPHPRKGQEARIYGCLGLFGLFTLAAGYAAFRLAGQKYAVFPDRLVAWQSFKPRSYRWDQVREIYQETHRTGKTTYTVLTSVGHAFTLRGEIGGYKRLGAIISGRIVERVLPAVLAALEAGRDVVLGPLRISPAGVVIDGQLEPWHRIGIPTFRLNPLVNKGTNQVSNMMHVQIGSTLVELGDIPNYGLLQALACHLSRTA